MTTPQAPTVATALGKRQCGATTTAGAACRAWVRPDRDTCQVHDDERQDVVRAARSKGAATTNRLRSIRGHRSKLDDAPSLVKYVANLVHQVAAGEMDEGVARVLVSALALQRQLVESSDLEVRLSALEARLAQQQIGGRRWRA